MPPTLFEISLVVYMSFTMESFGIPETLVRSKVKTVEVPFPEFWAVPENVYVPRADFILVSMNGAPDADILLGFKRTTCIYAILFVLVPSTLTTKDLRLELLRVINPFTGRSVTDSLPVNP